MLGLVLTRLSEMFSPQTLFLDTAVPDFYTPTSTKILFRRFTSKYDTTTFSGPFYQWNLAVSASPRQIHQCRPPRQKLPSFRLVNSKQEEVQLVPQYWTCI